MLYVSLTFDHELFLGENYTTEKAILIDTTDELLKVLVKNNVSGTFFTDVCSIIRYNELGMHEFPNQMNKQLKNLIRSGQDVQLHIHSNWLKSDFINGKWNFDTDSYRVQYYTPEKKTENNNWTMERIVKTGKEYLVNLLKPEDDKYSCVAFRAGGFCIQPEDKLISCLIENDILIDSSVAPGIWSSENVNSYDFRDAPNKELNWYISPSSGIKGINKSCSEKKLFEVPIATTNRKLLKWIFTKKKSIDIQPLRGSFISIAKSNFIKDEKKKNNILNRLINFNSAQTVLSLDSLDAHILSDFVKQINKKYNCHKKDAYISVICHPKLANDELVNNMDRFIKEVKKIPNVSFCSIKDVYEKIKLEGKI